MKTNVIVLLAVVLIAVCVVVAVKCCGSSKCNADETGANESATCCEDLKVRVNCLIEVQPSDRESMLELGTALVKASREDEGCIDYSLFEDAYQQGKFLILESWKSQAALTAHEQTEHFKEKVPQIQKLGNLDIKIFTGGPQSEIDGPLRVNCMVRINEGKRDETLALYKELTDGSLTDEGNIGYSVYTDTADCLSLVVFETWESEAALKAHFSAPHFTRIVPQLKTMSSSELQKFPL